MMKKIEIKLKKTQEDFLDYQLKTFGQRRPEFFSLELCGEAGELANLEKKLWRDPSKKIDQKDFEMEAADVFISLVNYCNSKGIDLENSVQEKLEKINEKKNKGLMGKTLS